MESEADRISRSCAGQSSRAVGSTVRWTCDYMIFRIDKSAKVTMEIRRPTAAEKKKATIQAIKKR